MRAAGMRRSPGSQLVVVVQRLAQGAGQVAAAEGQQEGQEGVHTVAAAVMQQGAVRRVAAVEAQQEALQPLELQRKQLARGPRQAGRRRAQGMSRARQRRRRWMTWRGPSAGWRLLGQLLGLSCLVVVARARQGRAVRGRRPVCGARAAPAAAAARSLHLVVRRPLLGPLHLLPLHPGSSRGGSSSGRRQRGQQVGAPQLLRPVALPHPLPPPPPVVVVVVVVVLLPQMGALDRRALAQEGQLHRGSQRQAAAQGQGPRPPLQQQGRARV